jgi:formate-dependent nitrite reductase membrane component NrfD
MQPEPGSRISLLSQPTGHQTQIQRLGLGTLPPAVAAEPSYYDIPFLKKPVWSWEIGCYFFLGGLSAASYVLARVAERLGGRRYRAVTRAGTAVAAAAVLPCPALLIADLGDPSRFHHMLRVFKPRSPMNLGSWVLAGYSGIVLATAVREWRRGSWGRAEGPAVRAAVLLLDAAGIPLALFFSGYTGVLLSGTSTPLWSRNPWLGPLFTASAISNGASAIRLALEFQPGAGQEPRQPPPDIQALETIDQAAHVAEAVCLAGYFSKAGSLARPLTRGKAAPFFWGAVAGLVLSEVLRHAPGRRTRRWGRVAAAAAGIAGGFALKFGLQQAGAVSVSDPEASRQVSRRLSPQAVHC